MEEEDNRTDDTSRRLAIAEMQVERSKVVMESLAGFCHALGQPATVLDMCYDAVIEIRSLLAKMKKRREYVAEAYLAGNESAGNMISLGEWHDETPPEASKEE